MKIFEVIYDIEIFHRCIHHDENGKRKLFDLNYVDIISRKKNLIQELF